MASQSNISTYDTDSLIPTGSWTLYFHSPAETKWTLSTFTSLGSMRTWNDFWTVVDTIRPESFEEGMFFMMRDPIPPLWESHQNIHGGCYSFRSQKRDVAEVYINYMIAVMLGKLTTNSKNSINGLSISPKRGFNIIKIWNNNAKTFYEPENLNYSVHSTIRKDDTIYTPFIQKKM
jgi:hypothetical protein